MYDNEDENEYGNKIDLLEGFKKEPKIEVTKFRSNVILINEKIHPIKGKSFINAKRKIPVEFKKSKKHCFLLFPILYFFIVTFLLVSVCMTKNVYILILFCANYFFASIIQLGTFPDFEAYKSRSEFEDELKRRLNLSPCIYLSHGKQKIKLPGNYIIDMTGEIDIPKSVNFIKIKRPIYNLCDNLYNMKRQARETYNAVYAFTVENLKNGKRVNYDTSSYIANSYKDYSNIGFSDFILSLLLLHWIKFLYCIFSYYYVYVEITPIKLISRNYIRDSPTKINFQGTIFRPKNCIYKEINDPSFTKFEKDISNYQLKQERKEQERKEEREREREKKRNTHTLSDFSVEDLFDLYIKERDDYVYAYLQFNGKKEEEIPLGPYDEDVEEEILEEGKEKKYIPNGINMTVTILTYPREIEIFIGKHIHRKYKRRY